MSPAPKPAADAHRSPEERYINDADFHALVRMLEAFIAKAQFTPTEMREAVILACIHYEMNHVRSFVAPKETLGAIERAETHLARMRELLAREAADE